MEDDRANLAELYQQAQEEKAAFLELNQNLQRKLSDYLRTVKKNEVYHRPPTRYPPLPPPLAHPSRTSSRPSPTHPSPSPTPQENKESQEKSVTDQEQRYFKCLAQVTELRHNPHPHHSPLNPYPFPNPNPHPHHSPFTLTLTLTLTLTPIRSTSCGTSSRGYRRSSTARPWR